MKIKTYFNKKIAFGVFIILATVLFSYMTLYMNSFNYKGLGVKNEYDSCPYNMDKLYFGNNDRIYEDENYRSRKGIDVSAYQGDIDWKKVKESGIDFAMIRLGYRSSSDGTIYQDSMFEKNLKEARKSGVDVGVYFFSQAVNTDEAIEEARYVLKNIRFKGVKYPVAFDMEPVSEDDRISTLKKKKRTAIADAFCQVIRKKGYTPVIYGNPGWLRNRINIDYLSDYDIWLAHYTYATEFKSRYLMWQYSDSGIVDGIDGYVDLNLYFEKRKE